MELVFDTSVLIDLDSAQILDFISQLNINLLFPSIIKDELNDNIIIKLDELKFQPIEFEFKEEIEINKIQKANKYLTVYDVSVFFVAQKYNAILLTGDRRLKELTKKNNIEVHGILWLLDISVERKVLYPMRAINALTNILDNGARLPEDNCIHLRKKWSRMLIKK